MAAVTKKFIWMSLGGVDFGIATAGARGLWLLLAGGVVEFAQLLERSPVGRSVFMVAATLACQPPGRLVYF
jgi:hypothetical protein